MRKENKKKGFTLIELLAVIVVLAIVSVLGASIVLPALANARKNAFVGEANNFLEAASLGVSQIQIGSITNQELTNAGDDYKVTISETNGVESSRVYCFTLAGLIKLGLFDKKTDSTGSVPNYNGKVTVTVNANSKQYIYSTTFSNKDFYVSNITGNIVSDNVNEYASGENFKSVLGDDAGKC